MSNNKNKNKTDLWGGRYKNEGRLWGDDPSLSAKRLAKKLRSRPRSNILEIGAGYYRDGEFFINQGHNYTGIEQAAEALSIATEKVKELIGSEHSPIHSISGPFQTAPIPAEGYDAVFCHRTLHLWGKNGLITAFNDAAVKALKSGGLLVVSARDPRDYDEEQMTVKEEAPDGTIISAEYKDRPGHLINFWNEARYRDAFGDDFEDMTFEEGTEIESVTNPGKMAHFTIMIAHKKIEPS